MLYIYICTIYNHSTFISFRSLQPDVQNTSIIMNSWLGWKNIEIDIKILYNHNNNNNNGEILY